ncbi:transposase [Staphylococcus aureus]
MNVINETKKALMASMLEMYVSGVSTRKVSKNCGRTLW